MSRENRKIFVCSGIDKRSDLLYNGRQRLQQIADCKTLKKYEITQFKTGYGGSSRYSLRETEVPASSLHYF